MKITVSILICLMCLSSISAFADECIEGDCVNGKGTMVYSTGHKFTGSFKEGMRHGEGVLLMPGNRKLVGVWIDNEVREGTFWGSDGSKYVGQWQYRERNGRGTLTYPDGREYVGEFKSGLRHGQGTMTYPDGRQYVGEFVFGERTGQGTMTYPDGSKYTGGFKGGERHGRGSLIYPDGTRKVGEFKNGEFMGKE